MNTRSRKESRNEAKKRRREIKHLLSERSHPPTQARHHHPRQEGEEGREAGEEQGEEGEEEVGGEVVQHLHHLRPQGVLGHYVQVEAEEEEGVMKKDMLMWVDSKQSPRS